MVLINVILPVFLVGGCGFILAKSVKADATLLTKIVFYLLGPALVFRSIYTSDVTLDSAMWVAIYIVCIQGCMFGLSRLMGRLRGWQGDTQATGSLVLTFSNCGNYGLPVLLFAFGEEGFALGIIYVLVSTMMQSTLGIGIASWHKGMAWKKWALHVLKVPYLYAFLLALLLRSAPFELPLGVFRAVDLMAGAAIPGQLLILGIQLAAVRFHHFGLDSIGLSLIKLVVPPLLGWGITTLFGITGLLQAVLILEAAMPSAVNTLVLAMHFRRSTELAATVVFVSTLLSLGTVALVLTFLR